MSNIREIRNDILREMYAEAEPPLDFDKVLENPDEMDDKWYRQHELSSDREMEILHKHFDKHDLTKKEETALTVECILNYGPINKK